MRHLSNADLAELLNKEIFNIGTGISTTVLDVAETLKKYYKKPIIVFSLSFIISAIIEYFTSFFCDLILSNNPIRNLLLLFIFIIKVGYISIPLFNFTHSFQLMHQY